MPSPSLTDAQDGERPAIEPSAVASRGQGVSLRWLSLTTDARELARLRAFLSDDERERAARFHFERDRNRFVVGRGSLRETLGGLLEIPPAAVRFAYGPQGKPELNHETNLRFTLSHSSPCIHLSSAARTISGPPGTTR